MTLKNNIKNSLKSLRHKKVPAEIEKLEMSIADKISETTGEDAKDCLERMLRVCSELQLTCAEYYDKKYYKLHEMNILNRMILNSGTYKNARMNLACERTGKTREELEARMEYVQKKYGVSKTKFFTKDFMYFSDETIEKEMNKVDYVSKVCDVTGWSYNDAKKEIETVTKKFGVTPKLYRYRNYFNMTEDEIRNDLKARKDATYAMLKAGAKSTGKSVRKFMMDAKLYSLEYDVAMSDYYNFRLYEKAPELRHTWIRHIGDVRRLKRKYRNVESDIIENKVKFNQLFEKEIGRKWWANNSDAKYEDFKSFIDGLDEIIVKPISLRHGEGIYKINLSEYTAEELFDKYMHGDSVLLEECIKQHHSISEFYPGCVHCCRIIAILDNGKCYYPQTSIKFGINNIADNFSAGGLCANIDPETGVICTDGATKKGQVLKTHPYSNKKIKGFKIPYWKETLALVEKMIIKVPGINYIGFDIAITETGPIVVEGNDSPGLRLFEFPVASEKTGMRHRFEHFIDEYKCEW